MALFDLVPVVLFAACAVILMKDSYREMPKGAYALFAGGLIMSITAGIFKALWKLLYALEICDFAALNVSFFPLQSVGFTLAAAGICGALFHKKAPVMLAAAVPVYSSALIFVIFMVLGTVGIWGCLGIMAVRAGQKKAAFLISLSFVCMMAMGYLSSRDFSNPMMNWAGEGVNTCGMILLLLAVISLDHAYTEIENKLIR